MLAKLPFRKVKWFFCSQNGTRCSLGKRYWQQGVACVRAGSGSRSLHHVLSYCARQIFSWRRGRTSRVHPLSIAFSCSQQPLAISPCIAIVSVNQRKQWCKTRVYSFLCLLTWDLGNRRHERKSEGSESC